MPAFHSSPGIPFPGSLLQNCFRTAGLPRFGRSGWRGFWTQISESVSALVSNATSNRLRPIRSCERARCLRVCWNNRPIRVLCQVDRLLVSYHLCTTLHAYGAEAVLGAATVKLTLLDGRIDSSQNLAVDTSSRARI